MRNDGRLSRMLHVLIHMARHDGPMTSDAIARMLGTNPVLVRRTMAGLRDAGYVRSEKGHGSGWTIAVDLESVTLLDVHRAVGGSRLFTIGIEHPDAWLSDRDSRQPSSERRATGSRASAGRTAGIGQPCCTRPDI